MKNAEKLIKSRNWKKRLIGVRFASIESVLQIAKTELYYKVCEVIVQRLEENKNLDIVKESYYILSNAKNGLVCGFVAENCEFEMLFEMAKSEEDYNVCEIIIQRLEKNKNLDIVKERYNELANVSSYLIRKYVAEIAEFEMLFEMAKSEEDYNVCEIIIQRLEKNKNLDIVKERCNELANANSNLIRDFVAKNAKIDVVEKIIKGKKLYYVNMIYSMYHNPNYIKATSKEKLALLKNILPEYLIEVFRYEKDKDVLLWILKKIK